jgi:hypothetical protein
MLLSRVATRTLLLSGVAQLTFYLPWQKGVELQPVLPVLQHRS